MEFLSKFIIKFENQKIKENKNGSNLGVVYTPNEIADFIIRQILRTKVMDSHDKQ